MDGTKRFSTKAEKYAKYRWDYPPEAIRCVLETSGVTSESPVADVGSGTGILTKHFLDRAGLVYAIEPNAAMRQMAEKAFSQHQSFRSVDGSAERTGLRDACADLIVVGQAIHWFEPGAARGEFLRVLKPCGWLAILWNRGTNSELGAALEAICVEANGYDVSGEAGPETRPPAFWFGSGNFLARAFSFSLRETWEEFFGGLCSASPSPDEDHPCFARFEGVAREVFERFSTGDKIEVAVHTELRMGQPR